MAARRSGRSTQPEHDVDTSAIQVPFELAVPFFDKVLYAALQDAVNRVSGVVQLQEPKMQEDSSYFWLLVEPTKDLVKLRTIVENFIQEVAHGLATRKHEWTVRGKPAVQLPGGFNDDSVYDMLVRTRTLPTMNVYEMLGYESGVVGNIEGVLAVNPRQQSGESQAETLGTIFEALREASETDADLDVLKDWLIEQHVVTSSEQDRVLFETLGNIAVLRAKSNRIQQELDREVAHARSLGASWYKIGEAAGITSQAAHRRWDAEARKKHSDYERNRRQAGQSR